MMTSRSLSVLVCLVAGCAGETEAAAHGNQSSVHMLDLTHSLDEDFPYIPVPDITFPFELVPIATLERDGVAANRWVIHEHLGTQIDAPSHFAPGGRSLDQMRADETLMPVVVVDFREQANADRDAVVQLDDIRAWEAEHGQTPEGACVMFNFGWAQYIHDRDRYLGLDADDVKHFPGISPEVADFLANERNVWGVGVDTISFDPGPDGTYQTHRTLLGADKWAVEAVNHLDDLPATGAKLFVGAPNVRGATGGPVRLIATW